MTNRKLSDPDADLEKHYPGDSWNDAGHNAYGCTKQLFILKKKHRQMKTLFSIGGWSYRANFPAAASTAASRATFASTAVAFVKDMGFDGIDIDWEYPADDTEAANFVLLLEAVRKELDAYAAESAPGYHFLLTIASPAGPQNYNRLQMTKMDAFLDAWHLMGYDYSGSFSTDSAHGSNLYPSVSNPNSTPFSTSRAITDYIAKGVPPNKIVLGVPLYGHAFESTSGIGQPYTGIGGGSFENGIWDYKALPKAGATMHFNEETSGTYSYDSASHELITFDDVKQANIKADYVKSNGLGGAMYWEASGDKSGSDSIISSIAGSFGNLEQSHNLLSYPASQYDNIANGMPGQ